MKSFLSLPVERDVLAWDQIVNVLEGQPDLMELNRFLERRGFFMCKGFVWKRSAAIIRHPGRPATDAERRETSVRGADAMGGKLRRAAALK